MKIKPETRLKLQNLLLIFTLGVPLGVIYNHLYYPHRLVEYLEATVIGIFICLIIGILEEFMLGRIFSKIAYYKVLFMRTLLYSFLISVILAMVRSYHVVVYSADGLEIEAGLYWPDSSGPAVFDVCDVLAARVADDVARQALHRDARGND